MLPSNAPETGGTNGREGSQHGITAVLLGVLGSTTKVVLTCSWMLSVKLWTPGSKGRDCVLPSSAPGSITEDCG